MRCLGCSWSIAAVISVIGALSGCVGYSWQPMSVPRADSGNTWTESEECYHQGCPSPVHILKSGQLTIAVKPHNKGKMKAVMILPIPFPGIYGPDNHNEVFPITLRFDVNRLPVTLNIADAVRIRFEDGYEQRPLGYRTRFDSDGRCPDYDYYSATLKDVESVLSPVSSGIVNLPPKTCIDIFFSNKPPDPERRFELILGSISAGDKGIEVPIIKFGKGSITPGW